CPYLPQQLLSSLPTRRSSDLNILMAAFIVSLSLGSLQAIGQSVLEDEVLEENIQTVRIYPKTADFQSQMESPVIQLNSTERLTLDRKSTRLNSSHVKSSYAVF